MNKEAFERLLHRFWERQEKLLLSKRKEYANDEDILINFKQNSTMLGITPEMVAATYLMKQVQSVCKGAASGALLTWTTPDGSEGMEQKITDSMNYLILLAALLEERHEPIPDRQ